ncbi:exopolysaccharide biosynthesis protein [Phytohalomonas tamaricis]|uniref:exopolysaccharide biosynthesis protein n=1 Tax=Phytohalomonas tamaricis TaxID=2081032 RepID=UPI000D0BCDAE|nr:exopolysaccharide biosynthesis protein [Phytohalomonas tamaricis]
MDEQQGPVNLEQMLERIGKAGQDSNRVTIDAVISAVGRRAFGPILLLTGMITLMPIIGDIPGMPTLMAVLVLLVSGQLLLRRDTFWLPNWLLNRSIACNKLNKALDWMRPPARIIDRFLKQRFTFLTHRLGTHIVAVFCIIVALGMPVMEFIPFSANGAGVALSMFGLSLIADDGLMALIAMGVIGITLTVILYNLV